METPKWRATDDPEYDEAERQLLENEWLESARKYITLTEECDCDCFLCMRGDHDEHCDWLEVEDEDE